MLLIRGHYRHLLFFELSILLKIKLIIKVIRAVYLTNQGKNRDFIHDQLEVKHAKLI